MTRDQPPSAEPSPGSSPDPDAGPGGTVLPTGPGPLVVLGMIGLFLGWAWRGQAIRMDLATPDLSWKIVGITWFVTAVTAGIAFYTRRTIATERQALTAQQAVARLVLGKTIDRLAAFTVGGSAGIVISYLGVDGTNARDVILRGLVTLVGAAAGVAAGLALEHACRVPPRDAPDLP